MLTASPSVLRSTCLGSNELSSSAARPRLLRPDPKQFRVEGVGGGPVGMSLEGEMPSYSDLLKDPRWQRKRLEAMEADGFSCQMCSAKDKTLHVHHKWYLKDMAPWDYVGDQLATLCEDCHESATASVNALKLALASLPVYRLDLVLGFVDAINVDETGPAAIPIRSSGHAAGIAAYLRQDEKTDEVVDMLARTGFVDTAEAIAKSRG